jgi:hypothetical protein
MKLLFVIVAAAAVAVAVAGVRSGTAAPDAKKVAVCHKTSSAKKPYTRVVVVGSKAIVAHQKHRADIIPAPRTCPQTLLTPNAGGTAIAVNLRGVNEQPEPADPDGSGTATIRLRAGEGQVCFTISASAITLPSAGAHIHRAAVDASGDIVVPLTAPGSTGASSGCVSATRQLATEILGNPSGFYVNVHTTDFPAGALRAQLGPSSTAVLLTAAMNGANEKPGVGDADGAGVSNVLIFPATGRLCYTMAVTNIILPTVAAHIHRGGADVAGPVVVPFKGPDAAGLASGCVTPDPTLVRDIAANPSAFYTNAHTRDFPGGAVRGPLAAAR